MRQKSKKNEVCLTELVTRVDTWVSVPQGPSEESDGRCLRTVPLKETGLGPYALDYPHPLHKGYSGDVITPTNSPKLRNSPWFQGKL